MALFRQRKSGPDADGELARDSAPSLVYTLEACGRRWKNVDVCGLVEALNSLVASKATGVLLDAISPAIWKERREAFSQEGFSHVLTNASSLPEDVKSDVISVMSTTHSGSAMRMEILETVVPGGASQLAEQLSSRLGFDVSLEARRTEDSALDAYGKAERLRHAIDWVFDAVLIVTGVCAGFSALAGYTAPGIIFVLAGLMRASMMKSVSAPFIAMPEGKLSASLILSLYEMEGSHAEDKGFSIARYVWMLSRKEPSLAIVMISLLGISLLLFLAAAPSVFQVLLSDGGTVTSLLLPQEPVVSGIPTF